MQSKRITKLDTKKITIFDDGIEIGRIWKKKIKWEEIVGLKEVKGEIMKHIAPGYPRAELFLDSGRRHYICVLDEIYNSSSISMDSVGSQDLYSALLYTIRNNSKYIDKIFENWISWRIVLPPAIFQLMAIIHGFILGLSISDIVEVNLYTFLIIFPFSYYWEIKSRKMMIKKSKQVRAGRP